MKKEPLVLCLTNTVAANFTANCLLAIGAKPAMVEEPSEAEELAVVADAILVNLGTVTERQAEAMRRAIGVANKKNVPWVLDPVGIQMLSFRRQLAVELVGLRPAIVRGNPAEIDALGPVDCVTLATGEIDTIKQSNNPNNQTISGGVPMLQAVTATGCAQGGLCAAFLGRGHHALSSLRDSLRSVDMTPREACLSASRMMKRAGEMAWERAKAPGSFQVALVDALWELSHD